MAVGHVGVALLVDACCGCAGPLAKHGKLQLKNMCKPSKKNETNKRVL